MQIGDCQALFDKINQTNDDRDVDAYLELLHDDYVFVRHQTGMEMTEGRLGTRDADHDGERCSQGRNQSLHL